MGLFSSAIGGYAVTTFQELLAEEREPVVIADRDGIILRVSPAFVRAYAWPPEAVLGHPLTVLIPGMLHDAHHLGFSRYATTGQPTILGQELDLELLTGDGRTVLARHFILAGEVDGAPCFAARISSRESKRD